MNTVIDRRSLADSYAQAAIDLMFCGHQFDLAARSLDAKRLGPAEIAIRAGLDRLAKVVAELPKVED